MGSKTLFSLGKIYPSDFLKPDEQPRCEPIELKLMMDEMGIVSLEKSAPSDVMWGERYWYRSSLNPLMRKQLADVVTNAMDVFPCESRAVFLDIAQNDGYMLSCTPSHMIRIGIDPVGGSIKKEAEKHSDLIIQDYFSAEVYKNSKYGDKKPKIISCISMLYDLEEPGKFLDDVNEILDDDGLFICQMSYSPLMLYQMEYQNICHEHKKYFSLFNILPLFSKHGFKIMDVVINNTNSGSFRIHAMKFYSNIKKYGSQTHRDVCNFRVASLLAYEFKLRLDDPQTWINFYENILSIKKQTMEFVRTEKAKGKVFYAYGASTKGNTLLQVFGLDNELITAIADANIDKHGLITIGTNIPIVSEQVFRLANPDYLIVLPVHFLSEFMIREAEYLINGGKMIVCSPSFQIISA